MLKNSRLISEPSELQIQRYLNIWDSLEDYVQQENSLNKLFLNTYILNNNIEDVLVKVCTLNQFYSTNIRRISAIANHIVSLNIDDDLKNNNINLVNKIASGHGIRIRKETKESNLYSFATKYCSHHKPEFFPIYDFYVEKMLMYFKHKDNFDEFDAKHLRVYSKFKEVLLNFRRYYNLQSFSLKQIDKYLWLAGKEHFPKNYGNNRIK